MNNPDSENELTKLTLVCDEFSRRLAQDGPADLIAEFLRTAPERHAAQLFAQLLPIELTFRVTRGETPLSEEYLERFAAHADIIRQLFTQPPPDSATPSVTDGHGRGFQMGSGGATPIDALDTWLQPVHSLAATELPTTRQVSSGNPPRGAANTETGSGSLRIGSIQPVPDVSRQYIVEQEIDRGGMGVVLKVRDLSLQRTLALKVIRGHENQGSSTRRSFDRDLAARFVREAQITGRLDHPGVVPIHELAHDAEGRMYFTMKYVQGQTLKTVYSELWSGSTAWTQSRVLEVLIRVCDTIAFAHARKVIHRDLKPSNIMVGEFGETYVMDWGLAKVIGEAEDAWEGVAAAPTGDSGQHTMYGTAIGTPYYMPPEQAAGKLDELDGRSDVYALGTLLYEMLARQRPYTSDSLRSGPEIIREVLERPPQTILSLNPRAPRELVAIATKAMARDRAERYQSATEMAEDLRAFLEQRVVTAYRTGFSASLKKWVARNQGVTIAGLLTLLTAVSALAIVIVLQLWNQSAIEQKNSQLTKTVTEKEEAISRATAARLEVEGLSLVSHSKRLREDGDATLASLLALEAVRQYPRPQATEALYAAIADLVPGHELADAPRLLPAVAWSRDGGQLVTAYENGTALIWDAAARTPISQLFNREGKPFRAAQFSEDGRSVLTGGDNGTLAVWDAHTGIRRMAMAIGYPKVLNSDDYDRPALLDVALCLGETCAVALSSNSCVHLVNLTDHRELALLEAPPQEQPASPFSLMAVNPEGTMVAVGQADGIVHVWNLRDQRLVCSLAASAAPVGRISFSCDGSSVLTCGKPGESASTDAANAKVWDVATGALVQEIRAEGSSVTFAVCHPSLPWIAVSCADNSVGIWSIAANRMLAKSEAQTDRVASVNFVGPSDRLCVRSADSVVRIWQLVQADGHQQLIPADRMQSPGEAIDVVAISPSGHSIATASRSSVRLWPLGSQRPVPRLGDCQSPYGIKISPRNDRLFVVRSGAANGQLWSLPELEPIASLDFGGPLCIGDFTNDGQHVVVTTMNGRVRAWESATGAVRIDLQQAAPVWAFASDGTHLLLSGTEETKVWNWTTNAEVASIPGEAALTRRLAPSGSIIMSAWRDGGRTVVARLDPLSGEPTIIPDSETCMIGGFSNDERYFWCQGSERDSGTTQSDQIKVIDVALNRVVFTSPEGSHQVRSATFNDDGSKIAVDYLSHSSCAAVVYSLGDASDAVPLGDPGENVIGWDKSLSRVVTQSTDFGTRLWDVDRRARIARLDVQSGHALIAAFHDSADLCTVQFAETQDATQSDPQRTALWTASRGELIAILPDQNQFSFEGAFLESRDELVTVDGDHNVRLWPLSPARAALTFAPRQLTPDESVMYGVADKADPRQDASGRQLAWQQFEQRCRLLTPVTPERQNPAWRLLDEITAWLGSKPEPDELQQVLRTLDRFTDQPFDADPEVLVRIAHIHDQHGSAARAAELMESADRHPRGTSTSGRLRRMRSELAPAVVSCRAADDLVDRAMNGSQADQDALAATVKWAEREAPQLATCLNARRQQLSGQFADAAALYRSVIDQNRPEPEPALHLAECELAQQKADAAWTVLRAALRNENTAAPETWDLWLRVAFRDQGKTPADVLQELDASSSTLARSEKARDVRTLLEQLAGNGSVRLNCGGESYIAADGTMWAADAFFTSGFAYFGTEGDSVVFSQPIKGTDDDILYQTERYFPSSQRTGSVGYRIPLPVGRWKLKLGIAEIYAVDRVFDVTVEGSVMLSDFDPLRTDSDWATAQTFETVVDVHDGLLEIDFISRNGSDAKVSCVEVSPVPDGE